MVAVPSDRADLVIVGGGMVGLTLAAALGGAGLDCVVIDRDDPATATAAGFDGRVSAIAYASWRLLAQTGVWGHVRAAQSILDIRVSDGSSLLFLHYDHRDLGDTPFGYMVENRDIRRALLARIAALPRVRLLAPVEVAAVDRGAGRVDVRLADGRAVTAPLAVAADGHRSPLRAAAGIGTVGWRYRQVGIVCTVHHALPHRGVAQERFLPAGPFAILPMTGNRSSLVWTEREELAPAILAADEAVFTAEMADRFGDHLGALEVVGGRWSYPLALYLA